MLISSCVVLWHALAVVLEPVAAKEWKASAVLAERHGVDINLAPLPAKAVPPEANYLAQPWLDQVIRQKAEEAAAPAPWQAVHQIIKPHLPAMPDAGDDGRGTDLIGIMESLDAQMPGLMEKLPPVNSPADGVLAALDRIRIPWQELTAAAARASSQFPPMGSTPPDDAWQCPANTLVTAPQLLQFMRLAELRTHAALEAGDHATARDSLLMQMRVIEGFMDGRNMVHFMFANACLGPLLNQIREGMRLDRWHPRDLDWIAGWMARHELSSRLTAVLHSEIFHSLREIDFVQVNPAAPDHQFAAIAGTAAAPLLGNSCCPFSQPWLLPLRERSEWLYRSVPPPVFLLWKAHVVRTIHKQQLQPLEQSGLIGLIAADEPDAFGESPLSLNRLALAFTKNEARIQLFLASRALALHRSIHQDYPTDLSLAAETLFEADFTDPFTAEPLKYKRLSSTAYKLYSIGSDFVDQQGTPITDDEGDICWHAGTHGKPGDE